MMDIALQPVANQALSVTLDGARYDLEIKEAAGNMCATVARDGVTLVRGLRLVARAPLLPYPRMTRGNFVLLTEDDELPYFDKFGTTQSLVYVSPSEVDELRGV